MKIARYTRNSVSGKTHEETEVFGANYPANMTSAQALKHLREKWNDMNGTGDSVVLVSLGNAEKCKPSKMRDLAEKIEFEQQQDLATFKDRIRGTF